MTTYHEALQILQAEGQKRLLPSELIPLDQSCGRILADDLVAPESHPAWNCSAMDGFAVSAREVAAAKVESAFPVRGVVVAGDQPFLGPLNLGVWEIMTGAPLPPGTDTVIKIEDCVVSRDSSGRSTSVRFLKLAEPGRNVRLAGEDFRSGKNFFSAGQVLRTIDILCLATLGITRVPVRRSLRIGLISTGLELVDINQIPKPGQIRNSSDCFIKQAMRDRHVEVVSLGLVRDDPETFTDILKSELTQDLDMVLSTGAISMGQTDFVGASLEKLKAEVLFRKVQVRPAKPILLAKPKLHGRDVLYLGLPGQPVSSAVGLRFFFDPLLRAFNGQAEEKPLRLKLLSSVKKAPDVVSFLRGRLVECENETRVSVHAQQQPSMISPMLDCEVWLQTTPIGDGLKAGDLVSVFQF